MADIHVTKQKSEMLRLALQKLQKKTPVTSIGPGSVARALAEVVVDELTDFYSIMDFNTSMGLISTAQGRALDLIGELYNVQRKTLGEIATIDQTIGAFYFYLPEPYLAGDITIPTGTKVFSDTDAIGGGRYTYVTTGPTVIKQGRTRAYASIKPEFYDSVLTAGKDTITNHNVSGLPAGVTLKCTNPKPIAPQPGFETDSNFRKRIVKSVRTSAGGTSEAMRFAALGVNGVRDVKIRASAYGMGSVEAIVIPEDRSYRSVIAEAYDTINKVKPAGIRLLVREPDYISLNVVGTVTVKPNANVNKDGVSRRAEIGIIRYLNTLLPGDTIVYSKLIQAVLDASDIITDVQFSRLNISGNEILRRNYTPESIQQAIPGDINISAS